MDVFVRSEEDTCLPRHSEKGVIGHDEMKKLVAIGEKRGQALDWRRVTGGEDWHYSDSSGWRLLQCGAVVGGRRYHLFTVSGVELVCKG